MEENTVFTKHRQQETQFLENVFYCMTMLSLLKLHEHIFVDDAK